MVKLLAAKDLLISVGFVRRSVDRERRLCFRHWRVASMRNYKNRLPMDSDTTKFSRGPPASHGLT
jgi:hypothetical protein